MWPSSISRFSRIFPWLGPLHRISNHRSNVGIFLHPSTRFVPASLSCLRGLGWGSAHWEGCRFRSSAAHPRGDPPKVSKKKVKNALGNAVHGKGSKNSRAMGTSRGSRYLIEDEEGYDPESDEVGMEDGSPRALKDYISAEEAILQVESHDPFSIRASQRIHDRKKLDRDSDFDEDQMSGKGANMDETSEHDAEEWELNGSRADLGEAAIDNEDGGEDWKATDGDDDDDDDDNAASGSGNSPDRAMPAQDQDFESKYLQDAFPDLAMEYSAASDHEANTIPVENIAIDSAVVAAWRCLGCDEVWKCAVFVRCILKTQCPSCSAKQRSTLATASPELVPFWDTMRNDPFLSPESIDRNSAATAHWLCPSCGQSYTARVRDCVKGKAGCPSCALAHMQSADVMAREEGALLQEWHPLKNGDLRLDQLQVKDHRIKAWWLCSLCGHEWEASLASRLSRSRHAKGKVCPACKSKGVGLS